MKIALPKTIEFEVAYLLVNAEVRYWEDATVNGTEDGDGTLIPMRNGDIWEPVIDLATGVIRNWPAGTVADIHYKVCDAGEYWLLGVAGERVAKFHSNYVPDPLLCPAGRGYGDYIILKVDGEGKIEGWNGTKIVDEEWEAA